MLGQKIGFFCKNWNRELARAERAWGEITRF